MDGVERQVDKLKELKSRRRRDVECYRGYCHG